VEIWENKLATAMNSGGFTLSLIAAFAEVGSVKYILRIEKPNWETVDYVSDLEEIKKLGELLLDLSSYATELPVNDKGKLRELLTARNLIEYRNFKKALRISQ
jgi:hypothetical protein